MPALNAQSPLPLYHQLADLLLARIRSGDYETGARIPSEPELARTFGIGRPTVRQATDLLIRKRVLQRRRGSGTFVVEPPPEADLLSLAGTLAGFQRKGITARTALLQRPRSIEVPADAAENPLAGQRALAFARLSRVDSVPVLLEEFWLDPDVFPGFAKLSVAGRSVSELVVEHYHLQAESADQSFRIAQLDAGKAAILGLTEGDPILLVRRRVHFPQARDALYAELTCRTDQLVFSQTLHASDFRGVEGEHHE